MSPNVKWLSSAAKYKWASPCSVLAVLVTAREEIAMGRQVANHKAGQILRRPASPSLRARHAEMSRAAFLALGAGWSGAVVLVFGVSALARLVG